METKILQRELSVGEILSQTFNLYSRNFLRYFIPFLAAGILTGVVATTIDLTIIVPAAPVHATSQQLLTWFPAFITASLLSTFLSGIVSWITSGVTMGITIKYTSDLVEKGQATLQEAFNYTLTRILPLLATIIITGILIALGFVALIVPGVIIAVMFSLVYPAIMLEKTGIMGSLSVSQALVKDRWSKTFGLMLVVGIIIAVANGIAILISSPFGLVTPLIAGILTAIVTPIFAIAMTLYYYSMKARTLPPPPPPPPPTF